MCPRRVTSSSLPGSTGSTGRAVGLLGGDPVPLDGVQGRAGGAVADQGGGDQGDQVGDGELDEELAQRLVVLASC